MGDRLSWYWPLVTTAIGMVVIALCIAVVVYRSRRELRESRTPQVPPQARPTEPDDKPVLEITVPRAVEQSGGGNPGQEDDSDITAFDRIVWEELVKLLGARMPQDLRGGGGRYGIPNKDARYTIACQGNQCAVVRLAEGSDRTVWRIVLRLDRHEMQGREERNLGYLEDGDDSILPDQARNFSTEGLAPLGDDLLMQIAADLRNAHRMGGI